MGPNGLPLDKGVEWNRFDLFDSRHADIGLFSSPTLRALRGRQRYLYMSPFPVLTTVDEGDNRGTDCKKTEEGESCD